MAAFPTLSLQVGFGSNPLDQTVDWTELGPATTYSRGTISVVGSLVSDWGAGLSTLTIDPTAQGNCIVVAVASLNILSAVASISGGGCTRWSALSAPLVDDVAGTRVELWLGFVETPGSSAITVSYVVSPGSDVVEISAQEFTSSIGADTLWVAQASGTLDSESAVSPWNNPIPPVGPVTGDPAVGAGTYCDWTFGISDINALVFSVETYDDQPAGTGMYLQFFEGAVDLCHEYFGLQSGGIILFTRWAKNLQVSECTLTNGSPTVTATAFPDVGVGDYITGPTVQIDGCTLTNGSPAVSATAFPGVAPGYLVSGSGVSPGTEVLFMGSGVVGLSANATSDETDVQLTFTDPVVPAGTTVSALGSGSVTMSANATKSETVELLFSDMNGTSSDYAHVDPNTSISSYAGGGSSEGNHVTLWNTALYSDLPAGSYGVRVVRGSYDGTISPNGADWFDYYVTFPGETEQHIGALRFPRKTSGVAASFQDGTSDFGPSSWLEHFLGGPCPKWHVSVSVVANGTTSPQSAFAIMIQPNNNDMYADPDVADTAHMLVGSAQRHEHSGGYLWYNPGDVGYPDLTKSGLDEAYIGYGLVEYTATGGSSSGFTYELTSHSNQFLYDTAYAGVPPTSSVSEPGTWDSVACLLTAAGVVSSSGRVRSVTTKRGRERLLRSSSQFQAGSMTARLDNRDRALDPTNSAGPYWPNVQPEKVVQVGAIWESNYYPIWTGYADDWPQSWPGFEEGEVGLPATDLFKKMSIMRVLSSGFAPAMLALTPNAYYRCGDPIGSTVALDSSGNHRNAIVTSDVTFGVTPGAMSADPGTAASFAAQAVMPFITPDLGFGSATGFSCAFWINTTGTDLIGFVGRGAAVIAGVSIGRAYISCDGNLLIGNTDINDGTWHHVVVTANIFGELVAYVDGASDASLATSGMTMPNPCVLSMASTDAVSFQEIGIFDYPLTLGEVSSLYQKGVIPAQYTGQGVEQLLDLTGFPGGAWRSIDTGRTWCQADTQSEVQTKVLDQMQKLEQTEQGQLFISTSGALAFQDRYHRYIWPHTVPKATLSDAGGSYPCYAMGGFGVNFDRSELFNDVPVTRRNGNLQEASNADSIEKFGNRTMTGLSDLMMAADADALYCAEWILADTAYPQLYMSSLTLDPVADNRLWPYVLGLDIGDVITAVKTKIPGGGAPIILTVRIEGIEHQIDPPLSWKVIWHVSLVASEPWLILNDPVAGLLDSGNRYGW